MSSVSAPQPGHQHCLLLGAGYTLSRVAANFPPGELVLTAHSAKSAQDLALRFPAVVRLDLRDPKLLHAVLSRYPGIRSVVDGVPPPENFTTDEIYEETKSRGALLKERGTTRLLYVSTTGVFGVDDGSWVNEETAPHPRLKRGKARLASEEGYRDGFGAGFSTLRVPAIYGPGRGIGHSLKSGRYRLIDGGTRWTNRIEVSDLARAITAALHATTLPPVLTLADGTPAQACDVVDYYCSKFGLPNPRAISAEEAFAAGLETLLSNQRVECGASWKALGIEPVFKSYKEGSVEEMKTQPPKS